MVIPLGYNFTEESNRYMRDMAGWFGLVPAAVLPIMLLSIRLLRLRHLTGALIASTVAVGLASITLTLGLLGFVAWPGFPVSVLVWWSGVVCLEVAIAIVLQKSRASHPFAEGS